MEQNTKNLISSKICSHCGGEADGFKCPKCGLVSAVFDPLHWRNCTGGGKLQAKCKKCGEAEDNCRCPASSL